MTTTITRMAEDIAKAVTNRGINPLEESICDVLEEYMPEIVGRLHDALTPKVIAQSISDDYTPHPNDEVERSLSSVTWWWLWDIVLDRPEWLGDTNKE